MTFRLRVCAECHTEFAPADAKSRYCPSCRTRTCPTCDKEFRAANTERGLSRYCSNRCYLLGRWGKSEARRCLRCGARITAQNRKRLYCSLVCAEAARAGRPVPSRRRQVTRECAWCGESVTRSRTNFHSDRVYCNRTCQHEWLSEFVVGEAHHNWKGGAPDYYGSTWKAAKRDIMERCGGVCERCGKRPVSQVHHRIPIRLFRSLNDAHYLSNLIAVCRPCHAVEHRVLAVSLPLLNLLHSARPPKQKD